MNSITRIFSDLGRRWQNRRDARAIARGPRRLPPWRRLYWRWRNLCDRIAIQRDGRRLLSATAAMTAVMEASCKAGGRRPLR